MNVFSASMPSFASVATAVGAGLSLVGSAAAKALDPSSVVSVTNRDAHDDGVLENRALIEKLNQTLVDLQQHSQDKDAAHDAGLIAMASFGAVAVLGYAAYRHGLCKFPMPSFLQRNVNVDGATNDSSSGV